MRWDRTSCTFIIRWKKRRKLKKRVDERMKREPEYAFKEKRGRERKREGREEEFE